MDASHKEKKIPLKENPIELIPDIYMFCLHVLTEFEENVMKIV